MNLTRRATLSGLTAVSCFVAGCSGRDPDPPSPAPDPTPSTPVDRNDLLDGSFELGELTNWEVSTDSTDGIASPSVSVTNIAAHSGERSVQITIPAGFSGSISLTQLVDLTDVSQVSVFGRREASRIPETVMFCRAVYPETAQNGGGRDSDKPPKDNPDGSEEARSDITEEWNSVESVIDYSGVGRVRIGVHVVAVERDQTVYLDSVSI